MHHNSERPHRRSIRLKGYDYAQPGAYFVTVCTQNHECLFGTIVDGEMRLSKFGKIAQGEWLASADIRQEIRLDVFMVMPNHIHGVIWLVDDDVGATGRSPLPPQGPKPRSLGAFVAGYKSAVTKRINRIRGTPGFPVWQRNYYDHIIRNEDELNRIREYIANNPLRWHLDRENPDRIGDDEFDCWLVGATGRSPLQIRSMKSRER